jgi:hypothetical protein
VALAVDVGLLKELREALAIDLDDAGLREARDRNLLLLNDRRLLLRCEREGDRNLLLRRPA